MMSHSYPQWMIDASNQHGIPVQNIKTAYNEWPGMQYSFVGNRFPKLTSNTNSCITISRVIGNYDVVEYEFDYLNSGFMGFGIYGYGNGVYFCFGYDEQQLLCSYLNVSINAYALPTIGTKNLKGVMKQIIDGSQSHVIHTISYINGEDFYSSLKGYAYPDENVHQIPIYFKNPVKRFAIYSRNYSMTYIFLIPFYALNPSTSNMEYCMRELMSNTNYFDESGNNGLTYILE